MKILYVANDRNAAQLAGTALRSIAPDVRLTWAGSLSAALRWVQDNRDVAALVLDTEVQHQSCASFVDHVRSLGLTAPIVVVAPEHGGAPLVELKAGADDYVVGGQSLLSDLPHVVTRALQRTTRRLTRRKRRCGSSMSAMPRSRGSISRTFNPSIEITETLPQSNGTLPEPSVPFDIVLVEYDHPGAERVRHPQRPCRPSAPGACHPRRRVGRKACNPGVQAGRRRLRGQGRGFRFGRSSSSSNRMTPIDGAVQSASRARPRRGRQPRAAGATASRRARDCQRNPTKLQHRSRALSPQRSPSPGDHRPGARQPRDARSGAGGNESVTHRRGRAGAAAGRLPSRGRLEAESRRARGLRSSAPANRVGWRRAAAAEQARHARRRVQSRPDASDPSAR